MKPCQFLNLHSALREWAVKREISPLFFAFRLSALPPFSPPSSSSFQPYGSLITQMYTYKSKPFLRGEWIRSSNCAYRHSHVYLPSPLKSRSFFFLLSPPSFQNTSTSPSTSLLTTDCRSGILHRQSFSLLDYVSTMLTHNQTTKSLPRMTEPIANL